MIIYGKNVVLSALQSGEEIERILFSENIHISGILSKIFSLAKEKKILVQKVPRVYLDKITSFSSHQGVVAEISSYKYYEIDKILDEKANGIFILILDEVQDPHNLGAILRVADATNVDAVVIPKRKSAKINDTVFKVSSGASSKVKVSKVTNIANTIEYLKRRNIWIIGLDSSGEDIYKANISYDNIAMVVGGEDKGLTDYIKSKCDSVIKIPMYGSGTSLNVAVATGVAIYEILRKKQYVLV